METIRTLLARIRWDPALASARFELGVYDRILGGLERVPLEAARFAPGDAFAFSLDHGDGRIRRIPLHRVREVRQDGRLIWARRAGPTPRFSSRTQVTKT